MNMQFSKILTEINKLGHSCPTLVGVEGATATGKTTFSQNLSAYFESEGKKVVLISLDNFHNKKSIRYQDGRESPLGYFKNAYDVKGIINNLLLPVTTAPDFKYRDKIHDLATDEALDLPWTRALENSVFIVEGSFSLREELRSFFDYKIVLQVQPETSENRAARRDAHLFESAKAARVMTRERYLAAHKLYNDAEGPIKCSDLLVVNDEPTQPKFVFQGL